MTARKAAAKRLEASISRSGVQWLRRQGYLCVKISTVGAYGSAGWPDLLVIGDRGLVFFIEFKAPNRRQTDLQRRKALEIMAMGVGVYVCRSLEDVVEATSIERGRL